MKAKLFWLGCLLALPLAAQTDLSSYQGPGVLSAGVGDVGTRGGQQVDLRVWGGVNGVYDTNVQPLTTDAQGNLVHVPNLFGVEASIGAYGVHMWQHAELGLGYTGTFRHYPDSSSNDGTDHSLTLGYTVQYSSRIVFDLRASGATFARTTGAVAEAAVAGGSFSPTQQLFDSRVSYIDVSGSMTFVQSPRTSYTFGGGANAYYYQANQLTSYSGYRLNGSAMHRVSMSSSVGGVYTYSRQTAPDASFTGQTHTFAAQYFGNFSRFWTLNVTAGASITQVHQLISFRIDPFVAAVFGLPSSLVIPFDQRYIYPSGKAELKRQFQRASASVSYDRAVGGGNGVALSTRNEDVRFGVSYTGFRKWNVGADASYQTASNLGPTAGKWTSYGGGIGVTYEVYRYTHLVARFDDGHYDFGASSYSRTTQRVTFGVSFSPGNVPLSLW